MIRRVAIIGTRRPSRKHYQLMSLWAEELTALGIEVSTGAARGSDQAAMYGSSKGDPSKLHIFLPWKGFNRELIPEEANVTVYDKRVHTKWIKSVQWYHPNYRALTDGGVSLHARNYGIVADPEPVDFVIACPHNLFDLGGTGQGMRVAEALKVPVYNILYPSAVAEVGRVIAGLY
jgi:hypothetical protein